MSTSNTRWQLQQQDNSGRYSHKHEQGWANANEGEWWMRVSDRKRGRASMNEDGQVWMSAGKREWGQASVNEGGRAWMSAGEHEWKWRREGDGSGGNWGAAAAALQTRRPARARTGNSTCAATTATGPLPRPSYSPPFIIIIILFSSFTE